MHMSKHSSLWLASAFFFLAACTGDEIAITDEAVDSGGSSSETELIDPSLSWSNSGYEAFLGSENTFPTLTNEYGVTVSYASSSTDVATISSDGTITLVGVGETTISASSEEDDTYAESSAYYTLTVSKSDSGISWSDSEVSIVIGGDYSLPTLSNPNGLDVTYASSDGEIATIDDEGSVSVIANGTVVITANTEETDYYEAGSASYTLIITKNTDGISWSTSTCTVTIGASNNIYPTLNNPGEQEVSYSSSNEAVATISSDGTVTLVSDGATTITAQSTATDSYDANTVSYALTVQKEGSNLVSAELSWPASAYEATMGSTFSSPTLSNPHGLSVTYSSSDEDVATISSSGTVTVVSAGKTTITATSAATDTYLAGSAYYTLTVSLADAGLAWSSDSYTATFGDSNTYPTLSNDNGLTVTYSSGNESVATIDDSGAITLIAAGTAAIKASFAGDATYAASTVYYTLKVSKGTPSLKWSASSFTANLEDGSWDFPTLTSSIDGLTISYTSSKTSVATVNSSTGAITPVAAGSTVITATTESTDQYKSTSATYTLVVTSSADDGSVTTVFNSSGDTSSDDDISNTTFTRLVTVTYSTSGATVSGYSSVADVMDVSVSGNQVTITYTGSENVVYKLTGTASDGFFKLYSSKKQAIWLSGVSITNSSGAAINNQSGKRTFVYVEGTNTLADGASAGYSTSGDEDMKGVFFSEGQLVFSGSGSLTVTANNAQSKSGIVSDDYVRMMDSPTVKITAGSSAGHGIKVNEYAQLSSGTLSITTKAAMKKGINSEDYVLVEGGNTTITVSGGTAKNDDGDYTGSAGIKADNYFAMTGGTVTITNSGSGGKGIRAGSEDYNNGVVDNSYISGGTLTVTTTGSESNDVSAKGIKIGWAEGSENNVTANDGGLTVSGGIIKVTVSKSESIEAKDNFTMTGGQLYASSSGDDAVNCVSDMKISGGYVYAYSSANDALDANGNLSLSGGYAFAITTAGGAEVAIDCAEQKTLSVSSGVVLAAYPSIESGASMSQTCYTMSCTAGSWNALYGSSYIAAFKAPSGVSSVVVSAPSLSKGYKGVSVGSTTYCNGTWATSGISGGTAVSLSSYSGGNQGGGPGGNQGGGPGGH